MSSTSQEPIAVVGFSFKLPQGVDDVDNFWDVLETRTNLSTDWPEDRINVGAVKSNQYNKVQCRGGHFITEDPAVFDAPFFSVTAKEAASMDPLQRWTLEASYRAFENAGIPIEDLRQSNTAVFSASMSDDYSRMGSMDPEDHHQMATTGTFASIIPNRVSWYFDLRGPSIHVDSACSSSLFAVDMACQSILSGNAKTALVTGGNLILVPNSFQMLSAQGFLSPSSKCFSFDHRANGYARGEGIVAMVIKPLADAIRDGNVIRAVIRASASNQDGRTPGLTQPSSDSQADLIRRVYEKANLPLDRTRFFEAHGTGTPVGDPIEMAAIGRVFAPVRSPETPLFVGSVKSNVGHLEGCAGLAGLVKTILALENGVIPPQANFEKVNPELDTERYKIEIPAAAIPWPCEGLRRASVNSFGFGGTNSHVIVDDALHFLEEAGLKGHHNTVRSPSSDGMAKGVPEAELSGSRLKQNGLKQNGDVNGSSDEYPLPCDSSKTNGTATKGEDITQDAAATYGNGNQHEHPRILVWSAADQQALARVGKQLESFHSDRIAGNSPQKLDRLAYTLATRRSFMLWRQCATVMSTSAGAAPQSLLAASCKATRSTGTSELGIAFVFTGQGAQYVGMGRGLLRYPAFKQALQQIDHVYQRLGCKWSLFDELNNGTTIDSPTRSQPLSTALQIALVHLLRAFGIVPKAVVGHSSGEIAAAYAAGALSLESASKVSFVRGQLAGHLKQQLEVAQTPGAMMSVNLPEAEVPSYLADKDLLQDSNITIACINSPGNVTLAGDEAAIDAVKSCLDKDGIFAQKLHTGVAYHSAHMDQIACQYLIQMGELEGPASLEGAKRIPMVSSVTGKTIDTSELARPQYWVDNMVSPVQFSDAIRTLTSALKDQAGIITDLIEVGPHPALRRPVLDTLKTAIKKSQREIRYACILHRNHPAHEAALELVGQLFCSGYSVDIPAANSHSGVDIAPLVDLPEYPFDRSKKYWTESRLSRDFRLRQPTRSGDFLGARFYDWNPLEPRWRSFWSVESAPWTGDHVVSGTVILPGAAMLIMAIEAVQEMGISNREVLGYDVHEAEFTAPVIIRQRWEERTEVMVRLRPIKSATNEINAAAQSEVVIFAYLDDQWADCFRARLSVRYGGVSRTQTDEWKLAHNRLVDELGRADKSCTRPISPQVFYDDAAELGIEWKDWFRHLEDIRWDGHGSTIGHIDLERRHPGGRYKTTSIVHPAVLDAAFQVLRVSTTKGLSMSSASTNVPFKLSGAYFAASHKWQAPGTASVRFYADCSPEDCGRSRVKGRIRAISDDGTILCSMENMVMAAVSSGSRSHDANRKLLHRVDWRPQMSMLSAEQLANECEANTFPDKDEETLVVQFDKLRLVMTEAIAMSVHELDSGNVSVPESMQRHLVWMRQHLKDTKIKPRGLSREELEVELRELELMRPAWQLHGAFIRELQPILTGSVDPLQVMFGSDKAGLFYTDMFDQVCDHRLRKFLHLAVHENPNMRIIEVGAGTGGFTGSILPILAALETETGTQRFSSYTYTDVSPAFFEAAEARWGAAGGCLRERMVFKTFNMKHSPAKEGFKEGAYDMVIAGSVLHATEDLLDTMRNVRKLLRPGGILLALETIAPQDIITNYSTGLIPGWWGEREEWRGLSAAIPESMWDWVFTKTGFSERQLSLRDYRSDELHLFSVIVSRATIENNLLDQKHASKLLVLVGDINEQCQIRAAELVRDQVAKGRNSRILDLETAAGVRIGEEDVVISMVDMWRSVLASPSAAEFYAVQDLISRTKNMLWVTLVNPSDDESAKGSADLGWMRTVRTEEPGKNLVSLLIESSLSGQDCSKHSGCVAKVFDAAFGPSASPEREYLCRDNCIITGRVIEDIKQNKQLLSLLRPQLQKAPWLSKGPVKLCVGADRTLEALAFFEDPDHNRPVEADQVEIEAQSWAINFRDVLVALGKIESDNDLGVDCAGVVTRVGPQCQNVQPGDRVAMVSPNCMRAFPRSPQGAVCKIPDSMSFETATSVLIPGMTAYFGLVDRARLSKGERVLIHSAAGSSGQMAVWIAKMLGAEVFATCSDHSKRNFLVNQLGISEDHIFFSRDSSFADAVQRMTQGRGVDVVFNSLSGDALRASWALLAPFGRFIDIGEADQHANAALPMGGFLHNRSYFALDLRDVVLNNLELTSRLLRDTVQLLVDGKISQPGPVLNIFPASDLELAFRQLQSGKNIGRCLITLDRNDVVPQMITESRDWMFDSEASYLIAGGTGGLGRSLAKFFASRGARHIILPSRSGSGEAGSKVSEMLEELRSRGINIEAPRCDVADAASLAAALKDCRDRLGMPPVKGCINAAMVLQDSVFANMSHAQWDLTVRSKVKTSWNLHHQFNTPDLDFFVLLSSIIGTIGGPGQANYAAGCAAQDWLAEHRQRLGLRGNISIDVGWMKNIGIVSEEVSYQRHLKLVEDMHKLEEDEFLALLTLCCDPSGPSSPQSGDGARVLFGLRTPDEFLNQGKEPPEMLSRPLFATFLHNEKSVEQAVGQPAASDPAVVFRATPDPSDRARVVVEALKQKLGRAMAISPGDVQVEKPLSVYGVDSLFAVELRNWILKDFSATVAVFDIMGNVPISNIGKLVVGRSTVGFGQL
ncbi:Type I Iterative PKS [Pyricularia oryzae]|uniref:Type I Iterative PKS n=2 Tax=Pyricularia TaxID=48558 RepID=A0ABQ8NI44_PYRGI|nr:Type I Iterative PKS [Pyricularia oryzae]KAI6297511.1 Type I Iterative PKS [Pyricularia grisea]KAI6306409.1 Type I Iterative PKS [Pyricularia oryzae]KAI6327100.1 Type I Iterative PKS [Pyricularia oryzae]KAI6345687.1 Type I Iterative PKS [Pyricularia oryzae]